jgi:hypothetical protein
MSQPLPGEGSNPRRSHGGCQLIRYRLQPNCSKHGPPSAADIRVPQPIARTLLRDVVLTSPRCLQLVSVSFLFRLLPVRSMSSACCSFVVVFFAPGGISAAGHRVVPARAGNPDRRTVPSRQCRRTAPSSPWPAAGPATQPARVCAPGDSAETNRVSHRACAGWQGRSPAVVKESRSYR